MTECESDQETDSCTEDEIEPKFKYVRLTNGLKNILKNNIHEAVTCISVNPRFLCLGTLFGVVHLLDHQGNAVSLNAKQIFQSHKVSVNQISVDEKGEHIATCSDDGMVMVYGLYADENNQTINVGQNVKSIALDPLFYKAGVGRRFMVGERNLTLYERTFLKGMKTTQLGNSEGYVSAIAWSGQWVAWSSSNLGVRVYDLNEKSSLGLIKWEEPKDSALSNYRCNLKWSNTNTLIIGWYDMIRICVVRKRNATEAATRNMPVYIVDSTSTFQTDFFICGIAPLDYNQLVVLGLPKTKEDGHKEDMGPVLSVLQYKDSDYIEICTDSLLINGYEQLNCNDYHLDCLIDENQYFIVSPKDIVVASQYGRDDRIEWLIQHEKFDKAMEVIKAEGGKFSLTSVVRLYLDNLIARGQYNDAAQLCLHEFRNNTQLWEEEIYKFAKVNQLRSISAYIPRDKECRLNPQTYEIILYEYLKLDPLGFLTLIKEWDPSLYNTSAVINAIDQHAEKNTNAIQESLAILYSHEKQYKGALKMYLKLKHKDVFDLIRKHDLYSVIIHGQIEALIELDSDKAIAMLIEKNKITPQIVVDELKGRPEFLYLYLDALDRIGMSGDFHKELIELYAQYSRDKLFAFLKRSNKYHIPTALAICEQKLFYPEMVYLLGMTGDSKKALDIILNNLKDIQMAIDFCKDNKDIELWNNLIDKSIDKPENMTKLLDGIVGYINPEILINRIKPGQEIPGLKNAIIKMLSDYSLQESIQDGCNEILVTDYFNLHEKLVKQQGRALYISTEMSCEMCGCDIIVKDTAKSDLVLFNCRHFFHECCLPENHDLDYCIVCHSKKPTKT